MVGINGDMMGMLESINRWLTDYNNHLLELIADFNIHGYRALFKRYEPLTELIKGFDIDSLLNLFKSDKD